MSDAVSDPREVLEPDAVDPPSPTGGAGPAIGAGPAAAGTGAAPLVGDPEADGSGIDTDGDGVPDINSPAKIIRIGAMLKQLLEEVRTTPLDEASRGQLRDIYERSIEQLKSSLSPELGDELAELSFDFPDGAVPSEVEGLFHGIQAALVAQQMSARQQLEGMRGQLPQGPGGPHVGSSPGPGYI